MKKIIACLLALCLLVALCACTDKDVQKKTEDKKAQVTETAAETAPETAPATAATAETETVDEPDTGEETPFDEVVTQEGDGVQNDEPAPEEDN